MASKKIRGITIEIGGDTTKLGKALEDSEKQTRSLQTELKDVERLLKFDPENVELLAQKQKILTDAVDETTKKLETLKEAEAQVIEQFNRGDIGEDQLRAFQREIIKTQSELTNFEKKLDGAEDSIEDVGDAAEDSSGGFTVMKGALADLVSNAISNAVSAIGDFIGSLFELSEATEEYRSMQGKIEGSAKSFGYSVEFANSKYKDFYKYIGDDQASTNAITNLLGLGTSTESVSKIAEGAIGVWASYGDSIPIESLTESINETVNAGKVTGTFADTINWAKDANEQLNGALSGNKTAQKAYNDAIKEGLPVEDAFNEALAKVTDSQERADIVAQFLNSTYGESKKTYDELNGSILETNEAELELKETQADLGETMSPVNNALTDMKNQALQAITPLVEKLADAFMDLYNWMNANPTAMKIVTGVVIALAAAFAVLAGALAIQGLINGVTAAIAFLNTTLLANPIVLIIAAIAALVAAFIYLWNNCEAFREFWIQLWEKIKSIFSSVVDWFKTTIPKIGEFFTNLWTNISGSAKNAWTNIKNVFSGVGSWFSGVFSKAWTAVKNVFSSWGSFFGGLWNTIKTKFSTIGTNIGNAISSAVKSGINGVISSIEKTINSGIGLINGAIGLINKLPGVNVGKLKTLSLPRLAQGGIVDNPTIAEIGEDGREAIIPLENNTGWLREVAQRLNEYQNPNALGYGELLNKLDDIYHRLERLRIVLDSGALVGETIDQIDNALESKYAKVARGW